MTSELKSESCESSYLPPQLDTNSCGPMMLDVLLARQDGLWGLRHLAVDPGQGSHAPVALVLDGDAEHWFLVQLDFDRAGTDRVRRAGDWGSWGDLGGAGACVGPFHRGGGGAGPACRGARSV
jgi:hypothetical protein